MHALILDDSRTVRAILGKLLRELGFTVAEGANGCEGLERIHQLVRVDLALVDWNMPQMNGLDFVQAVRALPAYDNMRLMMVTSETEMAQMSRALQAGANDYVMKPFTREIILEKLEMLGILPPTNNA